MLQASVPNVLYDSFRFMLQVCLFRCYKCFIWMLRMFYNGFQVFFMCFYKCFKCIFQAFYLLLDVCCKYCIWMFKSRSGVVSLSSLSATSPRCLLLFSAPPLPFFSILVTFGAAWVPHGRTKRRGIRTPHSSGHPSASKTNLLYHYKSIHLQDSAHSLNHYLENYLDKNCSNSFSISCAYSRVQLVARPIFD
jgi:hypothetical protein